ncbi:ankyrin repeat domain-containing protein [Acidimangrovimonas sediminis]|uniref:ankyrin repeat domain-containing protein n=1 Tax=Acidimangrovimonas sediminis TaxID=2056283 RepID=UPI000C7FDA32|nr:ankyrin repeat domain-containing protein [Acidimangrovimonas sediminis]
MANDMSDPNAKGPNNWPVIFDAIEAEDHARLKSLLDSGADIEIKGFQGATPVLAAAVIEDWPTVLYLLQRGARPGVADKRGFTLPYLAAKSRVDLDGRYGKALADVRKILNDRGLMGQYYEPAEVRKRMNEGRWPPR